jgi:nitrile hydratase subunit beta
MNPASHADIGGQLGHGPIVREPEGVLFHAPWERRIFALTLAMGATGAWNLDMSRAARENLEAYSRSTYYQLWFEGLKKLLLATGLANQQELASGQASTPPTRIARVLRADGVAALLATGASTQRERPRTAKFAVGDRVRTRSSAVPHHTRLPRYASGKTGVIERVSGAHVYPDMHARGLGEHPQWLYTVEFKARELWADARAEFAVSIDAWEPYLESA